MTSFAAGRPETRCDFEGGEMSNENTRLLIDESEREAARTRTSASSSSSSSSAGTTGSVLKSIAIATVSVAAFSVALLKASSSSSTGEESMSIAPRNLGLSDLAQLGSHRRRSISFSDIIETRNMLLPEQKRMPTHLTTWSEQEGWRSWTIGQNGYPENIDDRSTGALMFLDAIMPREFGDRFTKGKDPFHFAWVTQDYPQDKCVGELNGCPTLPSKMFSFGTVPKDKWKVSGLEQAPTLPFAPCIAHAYDPKKFEQCDWFSAEREDPDLPMCANGKRLDIVEHGENGESFDEIFDNLINKVVWRGSDWHYLEQYADIGTVDANRFTQHAGLCEPGVDVDKIKREIFRQGIPSDLQGEAWNCPPRLRAVLLSALEPDKFDCKFSANNMRSPQSNCLENKLPMFDREKLYDNCDFEKFKFLLDIGGGGGTSWLSTFKFLAMPGVLFHHETAMRDSFYDDVKPWVHYVPIMEDMSDLKKQYIWAMNNPDEIKAISKRATQYVKDAIKPSGLKQHAQHFVKVMQKYINSYSVDPEDKDLTTPEFVAKYGEGEISVTPYTGVGDVYGSE